MIAEAIGWLMAGAVTYIFCERMGWFGLLVAVLVVWLPGVAIWLLR